MSVEEARRRLWNALMEFKDSFNDDLDRFILEVQAEMPCSWHHDSPKTDCNDWHLAHPCPSCTARMKLKETADHSEAVDDPEVLMQRIVEKNRRLNRRYME